MESEAWTGSGKAGFQPGAALSLLSDVGPVMLHVGGAYVGQGVGLDHLRSSRGKAPYLKTCLHVTNQEPLLWLSNDIYCFFCFDKVIYP